MQHQSFAFELKREPTDDGEFEGYGAVFNNVDNGLDVIDPKAFDGTLGARKVKMLWQHDPSQPIGVFSQIDTDDKGLRVRGRILKDVQKGAEALALLKAGAIEGLSIGYRTKEAVEEGGGRIRRLTDVDLFEVSLVTFPMNEAAGVTAIKSIKTIREFETILRDAGFSRNEAKAVAANGFKGLAGHRDDGSVEAERNAAMTAAVQKLKHLSEGLTNG